MATSPHLRDVIGFEPRPVETGHTTLFALRSDPRFSYCLFVPPGLVRPEAQPRLVVVVHGTGRSTAEARQSFADFARWTGCMILLPVFPAGILGDANRDGYKYLVEGDIRYDRILLDMVREVGETYGRDFRTFALAGYSGGGHFTHRFLLLHPDRLWAASIGAPGSVTLLDPGRDWWVGVRNTRAIFGHDVDLDAIRSVPVHLVVGDADLETWEITHRPGGRHWMVGANDAGRTRPERAERLRASFEAAGVNATLDIAPGVAHDEFKCLEYAKSFLGRIALSEP
uniref:Alpha/beta hydrolase n=1 Tax=Bosea sp. NBC_00436 TaxID=2969620 RepID=A0A9E8A191_9HYPH